MPSAVVGAGAESLSPRGLGCTGSAEAKYTPVGSRRQNPGEDGDKNNTSVSPLSLEELKNECVFVKLYKLSLLNAKI